MRNGKTLENTNIVFEETNAPESQADFNVPREHAGVGPSSLVGRIGDNITFHTRCVGQRGGFERMWHWAWKDLGVAFCGLFKIFFSRNE